MLKWGAYFEFSCRKTFVDPAGPFPAICFCSTQLRWKGGAPQLMLFPFLLLLIYIWRTSASHLARVQPSVTICVRESGRDCKWMSARTRVLALGERQALKRSAWFSSLLTKKCWHFLLPVWLFFYRATSAGHNLLLYFCFMERLSKVEMILLRTCSVCFVGKDVIFTLLHLF